MKRDNRKNISRKLEKFQFELIVDYIDDLGLPVSQEFHVDVFDEPISDFYTSQDSLTSVYVSVDGDYKLVCRSEKKIRKILKEIDKRGGHGEIFLTAYEDPDMECESYRYPLKKIIKKYRATHEITDENNIYLDTLLPYFTGYYEGLLYGNFLEESYREDPILEKFDLMMRTYRSGEYIDVIIAQIDENRK